MKQFILASNNKKKIAEFGTMLSALSDQIRVEPLASLGYTEDIPEDGTTFEENSLIKALVPASMGYVGMADDSGLTVDALDGAPGVYSARYAGEHGDDKANRDLLLANLAAVPADKRSGAFVCVITMVFPEGMDVTVPEAYRLKKELVEKYHVNPARVLSIRGESRGYIGYEEKGEGGFGYDCLFCSPDYQGRTFAEITQAEKNAVSHRGRAMEILRKALGEMQIGE